LSGKAAKRATSTSPLLSTPPPSKRLRSLVTPAISSFLTPLSSVSILTFSSHGSYKHGMNQAINEVLHVGLTLASIEFAPSHMTSNTGLCHLLIPEVLQLQEQSKLVLVLSMTNCCGHIACGTCQSLLSIFLMFASVEFSTCRPVCLFLFSG
jgi:hypothetical protein